MRLFIGELLKQLNGEFPEYVTVGVLRGSIDDIDSTIHEAKRRDLIIYPKYKSVFNNQDKITISIKGFELLNQILIKETLEELNKSVHKFEMSSSDSSKNIETAISNLNGSTKKFNESSDKYSEELVGLTWAIYAFTLIVAFLPIAEKIIQLFKVSPEAEIFWLIFSIVIIGILMIIFHNNYKKIAVFLKCYI